MSSNGLPLKKVLIIGGGLSGVLCAETLRLRHPEVSWHLYEKGTQLGGNHTWCFHSSDLTASQLKFIDPFIGYRWSGYSVHFPEHVRHFSSRYFALTSQQLHEKFFAGNAAHISLNASIAAVEKGSITLSSGETVYGDYVFDARGIETDPQSSIGSDIPIGLRDCGYQKFLGLEIELEKEHGLEYPILMETRIPQGDDYRFIYVLPFGPKHLLVEDTFYSSSPELNIEILKKGILDWCKHRGWLITKIVRTEQGRLPIPFQFEPTLSALDGPFTIGIKSGFFHSTTGYSLPDLLRTLEILIPEFTHASIYSGLKKRAADWNKQNKFFQLLNRLLFFTLPGGERYKIMEGFYRLPETVIQNFYKGELTLMNRIRIFARKPPVPIRKALACIREVPHAGV